MWATNHESLRNTGIEHERLCEIGTASIINKFALAKSRKRNLKHSVCYFWKSTSTLILKLHCLDIADIKLLMSLETII